MAEYVKRFKKFVVCILFTMILAVSFFGIIPILNAQGSAQMFITPENISVLQGENFTITINAKNLETLFTWQVVLKFNATVVNCTGADVWIPKDNVFSGHVMNPTLLAFGKDVVDGLDYMMWACSLQGFDYVSVSEGVLFKANFTVKAVGTTIIKIVTKDNPVKVGQFYKHYSFFLDYYLEEVPFSSNQCLIIVEGSTVNLPPLAHLVVTFPEVDTSNYVVLMGHSPTGTIPYIFAYKGYPVIFNASLSIDYDGNITRYLWDFGDNNVTETSEPVVVHVYSSTGRHNVVLTVFDDGDPPLNSTYQYIVVVGLLLERFNWTPFLYGLTGVLVVVIIVSIVRKIKNFRRFKGSGRVYHR